MIEMRVKGQNGWTTVQVPQNANFPEKTSRPTKMRSDYQASPPSVPNPKINRKIFAVDSKKI
jgi:hypothetical protein